MFKSEKMVEIQEAKNKWETWVEKSLAKSPERQKFAVNRIYTPQDVIANDYLTDIGFPGEFPFTRGIQSTMYRGRFWTMRIYAGFSSADETNARYKYLLEQGTTGLSVAFDLPTQIGYDSDDERALGEVGKVGVPIDSMADMEVVFDGIPMEKISASMTINGPAAVLLAMYVAVAEKRGILPAALTGTIQNDVLKEYIARGTYIFPPKPSMRLFTDTVAYCSQYVPKWNFISVGAYHIREAGANAAQEVAFAFSNAIAYIEAAVQTGLRVDDFAPSISWIFSADTDLFEEVAKFRAARRLWARIMKERFGAESSKSQMLRFHTHTGGSLLTAQQTDNNVVRITWQALAAILGGTQSLATCAKDEAVGLPTEDSARLALRTQQLLADESGATKTVDPLAGSYYVEALTDSIERAAREYIAKIDAMGGALAAIEQGYMQKEMGRSAYQIQKEIEAGERVVIGVNKFTSEEAETADYLKLDPVAEKKQCRRLNELKQTRNNALVAEALTALRQAAQGSENVMPYLVVAAKSYATLGEMCNVLREVFGEYTPDVRL
jgi:methylmalonyl-CoA mutase N-terminal domain/subunit